MPAQEPPDPKLTRSLDALAAVGNATAIRSRDLSRTHRQRLQEHGLLDEVVKGWYVPVDADRGVDTAGRWQDTYWSFCADYLSTRFGDDWCLAPEHALAIHSGDWTVPETLVVRAARGGNKPLTLPYDTRLLDLRLAPPADGIECRGPGLRIQSLESALVASPAAVFEAHPRTLMTALWLLEDAEALATALIDGAHSTVAGRLIGALRHVARADLADALTLTLRASNIAPAVSNPFRAPTPSARLRRNPSPYPNRGSLRRAWQTARPRVLDAWPDVQAVVSDGPPASGAGAVVDLVEADAGDAAPAWRRGYGDACEAATRIRGDADPARAGRVLEEHLRNWHRLLLAPLEELAGERPERPAGRLRRRSQYRRGTLHTPPRHDAMRDLLPVLFEQLDAEPDHRIAAVLGHALFTYLAPFETGNELLGWLTSRWLLAADGVGLPAPVSVTPAAYRGALENAWFGAPEALSRILSGTDDVGPSDPAPAGPRDSW